MEKVKVSRKTALTVLQQAKGIFKQVSCDPEEVKVYVCDDQI